ncbi:MAG: hypothetical protein MI924_09530 [Chloroflexales bacterium]|nr:hypothetical protein [Chloroflexales bacterium]
MKPYRIAILPFLVVNIVLTACSPPIPLPPPTASPVEADRPSAIGSSQALSEEEALAFQPTPTHVRSRPTVVVTPIPATPTATRQPIRQLTLDGIVAFVDNSCILYTHDLSTGELWHTRKPITDPGPNLPPRCGITIASARHWRNSLLETPLGDTPYPRSKFRLHGQNGQRAWVESSKDGLDRPQLHIRGSGMTQDQTYELDVSGDRYVALIAYVANDTQLLASSAVATSGSMIHGGFLSLIDPQTGKLTELGIRAHEMDETIAVNPVDDEYVAVIASYFNVPMDPPDCRLAIVKVDSDRLQCVTAEYAIAPAWSPDGARLAYGSSSGTIALAAIDNLRTPHIIAHTPGTEQAPIRWIDNEHLLYVRYPARAGPTQKSIEDRYGDIRIINTRSKIDVRIAAGVAEPRCYPICNYMGLVVYYRDPT